MPFSTEQFLSVFELYNTAIFPTQLILIGLALIAVVLGMRSRGGRLLSSILAFFWAWMAVAYHLLFFSTINPAAYFFAAVFLLQAVTFIRLGVQKDRFRFRSGADLSGIAGWLMIAYSLVLYPLLGYSLGHLFPRSPTFGVPCPTTIFTFAMLLWQRQPVPFYVLAIPLSWSLIGFTAAFYFGIIEDIGLLLAALAATAILLARKNSA